MPDLGLNGFSWAKVLYSGIIIGVMVLLGTELRRLWFDRKLNVGAFRFSENGEDKPTLGRAFAVQVLNHHRNLSYLLQQEAKRRSTSSETPPSAQTPALHEHTCWPTETLPIADPKSALADVELSVQGINIKQILTTLRQWLSTPNEIHGFVDKTGSSVRGSAQWPRGPARRSGDLVDGQVFEFSGQPETSPAAFQVACAVIWAQAAGKQQDLADVRQADFCEWAVAWSEFVGLRDKAGRIDALASADIARVKQLREFTTRLIATGSQYPEVFRLRADLIDLLPSADKTNDDLAQIQEDRTTYTVRTDPEMRKLPRDIVRLAVVAQARPAIRFQADGSLANVSETWRSVLSPHLEEVAKVSRSTGALRLGGDIPESEMMRATGFVIAPNVIATVGFALPDELRAGPFPKPLPDSHPLEFSFDDDQGGAARTSTRVREILYASSDAAGGYFAILRLEQHDVAAHPPLKLSADASALEKTVGRYVFTVGYPGPDHQAPPEFSRRLLGNAFMVKRLLPGRVAAVEAANSITGTREVAVKPDAIRAIRSDISSGPGLAGGPLVDLLTNEVVGIHFAGRWSKEKGKFAFAASMADVVAAAQLPDDVKNAIDQR